MKRRFVLAAAALLLGSAALPAAPTAAAPLRVASMTLTADEILVEILPPGRLVAVTRFADDPGSSNVVGRVPPSVARFPRADLERLVALGPDLVVVSQYTDADFLGQLEKSGMRFYRMEGLDSLAGFREAILSLGRAVGEEGAARDLAARYDARLASLSRLLQGAKRPRVLYWSSPYTAGAHSAIGAIIEGAGGENVGSTLGLEGIAPLGAERAFVADPDVVLVDGAFDSVAALKDHPLLGKLRAVREDRVVSMPGALLVTLSQHAAESCFFLASRLHPDRVSEGALRAADAAAARPAGAR